MNIVKMTLLLTNGMGFGRANSVIKLSTQIICTYKPRHIIHFFSFL